MTSSSASNLLTQAHAEGLLSGAGLQSLTSFDFGASIQAGLGLSVDDVFAADAVLVSLLIDDSGSIASANHADLVREGHNLVLDALQGARQKDAVLAHTRYLNGTVLYPYSLLPNCTRMDRANYNPNGGTPLYDQTAVLLGTVVAKAQDFAASGIPTRSVSLIITDGDDVHSRHHTPKSVAAIVRDLFAAETHIVAGMGIDDGSTDFRAVFRSMGIPDQWILTPSAGPEDIRRAFQMFSRSAVRAGQSSAALGGFAG
jgi:hypothetical protein